jgi:N utilization substance protein B
MISRRLVRIKTLQALYAWQQLGESSVEKGRNALSENLLKTFDIYLFVLEFPGAFHLFLESEIEAEKSKYYPDKNRIRDFQMLKTCALAKEISEKAEQMQRPFLPYQWAAEAEKFRSIFEALRSCDFVQDYMVFDEPNLDQQKLFLENLFVYLAGSSEIFEGIMEDIVSSWNDDGETIMREVLKTIASAKTPEDVRLSQAPDIADEDIVFGLDLFSEVIENGQDFEKTISEVTDNWDPGRIAVLDLLAIKMALAEYLFCPEIPVKVTINEYLDIIKDYSTPGSSRFLNGVLDKLRKKLETEGKIQKSGRGLREH